MTNNNNKNVGLRDAIILSLAAQNKRQEAWVRDLTPAFKTHEERNKLNVDGWSLISDVSQQSRQLHLLENRARITDHQANQGGIGVNPRAYTFPL